MVVNKSLKDENANLSYFRSLVSNLDLDIETRNKLSIHLLRTDLGSNEVLMSPIAKEHNPDDLLKEFDKVFNSNQNKMNPTLLQLEDSNRAKFGPRSISVPWKEREETLLSSFKDEKHDIRMRFPDVKSKLRPITLSNALKLLKNNTNSGLPYYTRKGLVKERVFSKFDSLIKRKDPCILFTRTQEQRKTRNVWGFPMADTLNEMRYYAPLLEYQKHQVYRAALNGPIEVSKAITLLIKRCRVDQLLELLSVDFIGYDNSVRKMAQTKVFDFIKLLFQRDCSSDIDYIAERFSNIPILTPKGLIDGDHGIPSGSTFTNEVGSLTQLGMALDGGHVTLNDLQTQGDDGAYVLKRSNVDKLFNNFTRCGVDVNKSKSYISRDYIIYLQNLYHSDYEKDGIISGIYPVYRALNRILYQERWSTFEDYEISGKDYYSIRTICIVENCKYHPLFKELVKFVLKYDKYSLEYSEKSIAKYVQMISKTQGADEILKHQYGDDVSGIRSFETVKLIKELS